MEKVDKNNLNPYFTPSWRNLNRRDTSPAGPWRWRHYDPSKLRERVNRRYSL